MVWTPSTIRRSASRIVMVRSALLLAIILAWSNLDGAESTTEDCDDKAWTGLIEAIKEIDSIQLIVQEVLVDEEPLLDVDNKDELVLKRVRRGIGNSLGPKKSETEWSSGQLPVGVLIISSGEKEATVKFNGCFWVGGSTPTTENCFFSFTLAKVVDDLIEAECGRRLAEQRVKSLSGEQWLQDERDEYYAEEERNQLSAPADRDIEGIRARKR